MFMIVIVLIFVLLGVKFIKTSYLTSTPPMQKSIMSTQINQDDMKKNSSTRKVDAVMTKMMAPFTSMLIISLSESSFTVSSLEDPYQKTRNLNV